MKELQKVLIKDIVIPAGTVFSKSPIKTIRSGDNHFSCCVGLSINTCGFFEYYIGEDDSEQLAEYFTELK